MQPKTVDHLKLQTGYWESNVDSVCPWLAPKYLQKWHKKVSVNIKAVSKGTIQEAPNAAQMNSTLLYFALFIFSFLLHYYCWLSFFHFHIPYFFIFLFFLYFFSFSFFFLLFPYFFTFTFHNFSFIFSFVSFSVLYSYFLSFLFFHSLFYFPFFFFLYFFFLNFILALSSFS